jgi:hypothetical protein
MNLLEQYLKEMEKDVFFDDFTIKETQMKLPAIKHKWVGRLIRHKQEMHNKKRQMDEIKVKLVDQAKKSSAYQVSNAAAEKVVMNHSSLKTLQHEIVDIELIIELLEKVEKLFTGMSFDIKNLVEIMKMETL